MAHLLLIDDEAGLLDALGQILALQGHRVTSVTSGDEAATLLLNPDAEHPDLIISDLHMHGLDGLALVELARNSPALHFVPFLLMSASSYPGGKDPAGGPKNVWYIRKPFEIDTLLEAVKKGLDASRRH
jgi:CheY-like chemotaxis protein